MYMRQHDTIRFYFLFVWVALTTAIHALYDTSQKWEEGIKYFGHPACLLTIFFFFFCS